MFRLPKIYFKSSKNLKLLNVFRVDNIQDPTFRCQIMTCIRAKTTVTNHLRCFKQSLHFQKGVFFRNALPHTQRNILAGQVQKRFCSSGAIASTLNKNEFVNDASSPTHELGSATFTASSLFHSLESIEYIPPPPVPIDIIPEQVINALGEPTFSSLGLGGWMPIGLIQNGLEFLHVSLNLPWWGAIAVATVIIRMSIFPLVILSQRNAAKMANNMPQLQVLQMKMSEARNSGNQMEAARIGQEMAIFMKEKDLSPLKNILVPLAQAPIFLSMFIGLRKCANLPVDSMKDGGLLWFMDLTVCDPYYMLPVITSLTMLATIELGTDGAKLSGQNMQVMKWVLRGMPFVVFPFALNFPAAVLCYWVTTNFVSLIQVSFLRIPTVRDFFKIDPAIHHKPETLPGAMNKKGPIDGMKESWSNMKISREIADRQKFDEMRFRKAGSGPILQTYKYDPTKAKPIDVQAKVK